MTTPTPQFDDLEARLPGLLAETPDAGAHEGVLSDAAQWADNPCENEALEALLARDTDLRSAVVDLRLGRVVTDQAPSDALRQRLHALMPTRPSIAGRIGGWSIAAAAAILLAFGGYWLGAQSTQTRSLDQDTLLASTFGFDDGLADASFLDLTLGGTEGTTP